MALFKSICIIVYFVCSTLGLSAQSRYTLSGTVSDASNGESLIGASISEKGMQAVGAISNAYGYYSLSLSPGKHTLRISYLGYEELVVDVNLQGNELMNIKLMPVVQQLEDVVVTAQAKNHNITSSDMGMQKLVPREIAKIPVIFGEADVMKTLKLTPGVKSVGEGNGGMFVRGGNNSQNLILLDEATVYNADHLLGFFSTFNSDAIKDMQMYKGTAPASYGGRTSSVLDIKMNEGNNQDFHVGGGVGLISSRLNVEGPIVKDKASFLVTARRTYADLFLKLSSDEMLNNNQLYFYDFNAKMNCSIDKRNKVYWSGYMGRDVFNFQKNFGIDWGNVSSTLRWNHIAGAKLFMNTSLIYSDYDYKVDLMEGAGFSLTSQINNWNLKEDFAYYLNTRNTLNWGMSLIHHSVIPGQLEVSDSSNFVPMQLQDKKAFDNAVYFSYEWKPNSRLNIHSGIRFSAYQLMGGGDFYSYNQEGILTSTKTYKTTALVQSYLALEPRMNVSYIFNEHSSVKAGYTRNSQNLHLISNSTSSLPTDIWLLSSPNIKPEISDQGALGYFFNFADNQYQLSLEGYFRWMQNQIDLREGADINANEYIEGELLSGVGRAYGVEFLLKKTRGRLNGWLSYTAARTERKINGINHNEWYLPKHDIAHDVTLVTIYDMSEKWSLSATWVYHTGNAVTLPSGKYFIDDQVQYYYSASRMPAYHRLDVGATRILKKSLHKESSLNFSIYNAYGHKNPFSIDFEQDKNDPTKTNAVMTYLFTFVPSVTYNFKF